ncbi:MAG: FtsX-like permease family protein [Hyphomicrobiales bacterium]
MNGIVHQNRAGSGWPNTAGAPRLQVGSYRRSPPIIPQKAVTNRTLALAVALMCFLACIALAGVLIVTRAVHVWNLDIAGEVSVQIQPVENHDMERQLADAVGVLKATKGVSTVRVFDRDETIALLKPWIGEGIELDQLPIPRLIAVGIDTDHPPDLSVLAKRLETGIAGATLDTHRQWQAQLAHTADTLLIIGYGAVALIALSAMVMITFATKAAIEANRDVVEVLHLVGARDRFIALQIQWHFFKLGLRAGLAGTFAGILVTAFIGLIGQEAVTGGGSRFLAFAPTGLTMKSWLVFLLVPAAVTFISLVTPRFTVMRILDTRSIDRS